MRPFFEYLDGSYKHDRGEETGIQAKERRGHEDKHHCEGQDEEHGRETGGELGLRACQGERDCDEPVYGGGFVVVIFAAYFGDDPVAVFEHGAGGKDAAGFFALEFGCAEAGEVAGRP